MNNDYLTIMIEDRLTDVDRKTLSSLYQPLVSKACIEVFLKFYDLINFNSHTSSKIDVVSYEEVFGKRKEDVEECFKILNTVGLIKLYQKDAHLIVVVNNVLKPSAFFQDKMLASMLALNLGKEKANELAMEFLVREYDFNSYQELKYNMSDTYEVVDSFDNLGPSFVNQGINFSELDFNYNHFYLLLDGKALLKKEILNDSSFKDLIYRYAFLYNLSVEDALNAVLQSVKVDQSIDYEMLDKCVRRIYDEKGVKRAFIPKLESNATNSIVKKLDSTSPNKLVSTLYNTSLTSSEIKMFDELLVETMLPVGVINLCINQVMERTNGEIPAKNYFLKVLNTWKRAGVVDTASALEYLNTPVSPKTPSKKVKETPAWYKEQKQEEKKQESVDLSDFFKKGK